MEGSYPILIDGVQTCTLTVARDGLMTVFLAECEDPGWLLRLAVYGPEGTGYLGVMIPEGGRLRLKKRLSRAALAGFPSQLRFAGPAGMAAPEEASGQPEPAEEPAPEPEKASDAPAEAPAPARQAAASAVAEADEPAAPAPAEPSADRAAPEPAAEKTAPAVPAAGAASRQATLPPVPEASGDINWFATPEGILVGTDGENELVAIEADDVRLGVHGRGVLRRIEGKNYMIFKAHNGVASIR